MILSQDNYVNNYVLAFWQILTTHPSIMAKLTQQKCNINYAKTKPNLAEYLSAVKRLERYFMLRFSLFHRD